MTDGIDTKCRIEHGKGATDTGKEKTADSPCHPVLKKSNHERGGEPAKHKGRIVAVLPNGDRINRHARGIFGIRMRVWGQQPPAVTMPESQLSIVGVFLAVAVRMVTEMISGPFDGGVLQGPRSSNQERSFHPVRTLETAMGHEAMVADCDSESADEIEQSKQRPVKPCVVIEIAVERHADHGAKYYGGKQENRPASMVASYDRAGNVCVPASLNIGNWHSILS